MNYEEHCEPRRDKDGSTGRPLVDGFYLQSTAKTDERGKPLGQEAWADGIAVKAKLKDGTEQSGLLWRFAAAPFSVKVGDEVWGLALSRRTWSMPFTLRLEKFEREVHPGTENARRFTSHVTVTDGGREQKRIITMNEPLRSKGLALFQQSFDMQETAGGVVKRSQFQVVRNPSDHWPLISCIAAGIGLLIHVFWRLARHLHRSANQQAVA
ncbi:MAG: cytochrome c biogenesis protein ResB [Roseimicrobium sp.]